MKPESILARLLIVGLLFALFLDDANSAIGFNGKNGIRNLKVNSNNNSMTSFTS